MTSIQNSESFLEIDIFKQILIIFSAPLEFTLIQMSAFKTRID